VDTLITQGTLTLSMVVTVPYISSNRRSRIKRVTLARYHSVSKSEAVELKAKFLHHNDELVPDFITAKWEFVEYI
jgi:hypothetical protein